MNPFLPKDEYQNIPCVVYFRLEPKQKAIRKNYVCFGGMKEQGIPSLVHYIAPINKTCIDGTKVADGAVEFYMDFMKQIIKRPTSPKFLMKKILRTPSTSGLTARGWNIIGRCSFSLGSATFITTRKSSIAYSSDARRMRHLSTPSGDSLISITIGLMESSKSHPRQQLTRC